MAVNVPDCEVVISDYLLTFLANQSNLTSAEVEQLINEQLGPCEDQLFNYLSDGFVYSLISLYCVIMPIGFFGNLCIIMLIATTPKLQKSLNFLLLSLAVSDLILTMCLPWTLNYNISYDYVHGNTLCRAIPPIQGTSVASSIYVLVVMAVERHQAIIYPTHERALSSKSNMAICIAVVWCLALCIQDILFWNGTEPSSFRGISYYTQLHACGEIWSEDQAYSYSIAIIVILYCVPLFLLVVTYARIGYFLSIRRPVGNILPARAAARAQRRRRLLLLFVLLVVVFAVFWGPYFIIQCIKACRQGYCSIEAIAYLQWLGHSNVALDPLLYAALHVRMREHFYVKLAVVKKFFRSFRCCKCCKAKDTPLDIIPELEASNTTQPFSVNLETVTQRLTTAVNPYTLAVASLNDKEIPKTTPILGAHSNNGVPELPGVVIDGSFA